MNDLERAKFDAAVRSAGTRVRKKFNPARIGQCTGEVEGSAEDLEIRVSFNSQHPEWVMAEEIELIEGAPADPVALLLRGQAGRARDLRRELARVQLSGRLSEVFYSMDTTNTEFLPHQFKPVLAMLDSPSQGLLIADEVGLGKTIEAGLIWTELRFRKQARRLLVVCPAMLTEKWKLELQNRFGTVGAAHSAQQMLEFLDRPEPTHQDTQCLICSLQGIRPPSKWNNEAEPAQSAAAELARRLQAEGGRAPVFDLTIIDEAHYLRNPETASAELGSLLRQVSSHLVLLTATPINTKDRDLHTLLRLVDPDQFRFEHEFAAVLEANRPLVRASTLLRQSRVTPAALLEPLLEARQLPVLAGMEQLKLLVEDVAALEPEATLTPAHRVALALRIERTNLLGHAVTRTRKQEVLEKNVVRDPKRQPVAMTTAERALYDRVTEGVRRFAATRMGGVEGFLLATPQRQMASCMFAAAKRWLDFAEAETDKEFDSEALDHEGETDLSPLVAHLSRWVSGVDLDALRSGDSKFKALRQTLSQYFADHPTEKVIVFSYFRDTLAYLHERLSEAGITSVVVRGGDEKVEVIRQFENTPGLRVLLSSEVAAEGVDLQFMRLLVNYDLPWNPMKVEQRIGRIDRIGQKAERIAIVNLVYSETIDDRILSRLYERLDLFRRALGGAEDIIGDEIACLTQELLSGKLSSEQEEARIEQTAAAIEQRRSHMQMIEEHESDLIGLGDFVRSRIIDARNGSGRVSDRDLFQYVQEFLHEYAAGHLFQPDPDEPLRVRMRLPPTVAVGLERYIEERRLRRSKLTSGQETLVRIENHVVGRRDAREEPISQFHPLIGFIGQHYQDLVEHPPAVAVEIESAALAGRLRPGLHAFVTECWSFQGTRQEELVRAVFVHIDDGSVVEGTLAADVLGQLRLGGRDWVGFMGAMDDASHFLARVEEAQRALSRAFAKEGRGRRAENDDRARLQRQSIDRNFARRDELLRRRLAESELGDARVRAANRKRITNQREELRSSTEMQLARLDRQSAFEQVHPRCCSGILRVLE